ncbi:MAG: hypothetical protein M1833_001207 [Piccolia ochrophora]|nr:MAG: hypothetical protein M1833_001207 [Piccolia ochrophora]
MQGFFRQPVDNLKAEPLIAHWIRSTVPTWRTAVVVSKNPGGTKRVTSLADVLQLSFGIVTLDKRRGNLSASVIFDGVDGAFDLNDAEEDADTAMDTSQSPQGRNRMDLPTTSMLPPHPEESAEASTTGWPRSADPEEYNDERARDVITGRLIDGKLVDDDYSPSPTISASASIARLPHSSEDPTQDPLSSSMFSTSSVISTSGQAYMDGTYDGTGISDEEDDTHRPPDMEQIVTLVGNVKGKTVFIVDDMIDKPRSWIAAAETVVKRGGAKKL